MTQQVRRFWSALVAIMVTLALLLVAPGPAAQATPPSLAPAQSPPFSLVQELISRDLGSAEPVVIADLVPGVPSILRTTVSNASVQRIFVKLQWLEVHFGAVLAHDSDLVEEQLVRLEPGTSRQFVRAVPPLPPSPATYAPIGGNLNLKSICAVP